MVEPVLGGKRLQSVTLGRAANFVIAAQAGIQVGMRRAPLNDWIPALAGMTKADGRRRFDNICRGREEVARILT